MDAALFCPLGRFWGILALALLLRRCQPQPHTGEHPPSPSFGVSFRQETRGDLSILSNLQPISRLNSDTQSTQKQAYALLVGGKIKAKINAIFVVLSIISTWFFFSEIWNETDGEKYQCALPTPRPLRVSIPFPSASLYPLGKDSDATAFYFTSSNRLKPPHTRPPIQRLEVTAWKLSATYWTLAELSPAIEMRPSLVM